MRLTIKSPNDIHHYSMIEELTNLIKSGVKTNEITLHMAFSCDEPLKIIDEFRKIKNKIALNVRFN